MSLGVTQDFGALYAATFELRSDEVASCPAMHRLPTMRPLSATFIEMFQTPQVGLIILYQASYTIVLHSHTTIHPVFGSPTGSLKRISLSTPYHNSAQSQRNILDIVPNKLY